MDLLVIKCDTDYLRFKDDRFFAVGLDKASVFPLDRLEDVNARLARVQANGCPTAAIYRLTLTESAFNG